MSQGLNFNFKLHSCITLGRCPAFIFNNVDRRLRRGAHELLTSTRLHKVCRRLPSACEKNDRTDKNNEFLILNPSTGMTLDARKPGLRARPRAVLATDAKSILSFLDVSRTSLR